jgi:hypothetical protein
VWYTRQPEATTVAATGITAHSTRLRNLKFGETHRDVGSTARRKTHGFRRDATVSE